MGKKRLENAYTNAYECKPIHTRTHKQTRGLLRFVPKLSFLFLPCSISLAEVEDLLFWTT